MADVKIVQKDLGPVSAYAIAVKHGYKGTEEEWAEELINAGNNAAAAAKSAKEAAETLETVHETVDQETASAVQAVQTQQATSEQEVKDAAEAAGSHQRSLIEAKGAATLATIPTEYTQLYGQVQKNAADILLQAPAIVESVTAPMVSITDGAARPAVSLVTHIAPVSGCDRARVLRAGKNLFPGETYTFVKTQQVYLPVPLAPGDYTISAEVTTTDTDAEYCRAYFDYADGGNVDCNVSRSGRKYGKITATKPITRIRLMASTYTAVSEGDTATWANVQLERGSEDTVYEPYQGQTLTADLPETVYGGTLDWGTGVLKSTLDADGNPLAEPKVYQITPPQLELLKGVNNVCSDCGDTTLSYVADTKPYIDKKIAAIAAATV